MIWLCVTPERAEKTCRLMQALAQGWPGSRICIGLPPDDGNPFIVWGCLWTGFDAIKAAYRQGRPYWHVDNGYFQPARGTPVGYYRMTYRGFAPVLLRDCERRLFDDLAMLPWRQGARRGETILFAHPGTDFGAAIGLDMKEWIRAMRGRLKACFPAAAVVERPRHAPQPLAQQLRQARALVTHASVVAVDAVRTGVPVFVDALNPAAPVGRTDLDFADPALPDRAAWWRSLMNQQFTLTEMADGTAYRCCMRVAAQAGSEARAA